MNDMWNGIVTIAIAIVGVATLSVIVSKQSNTSGVIQAATAGFSQSLSAAVSPITGSTGMTTPTFSTMNF